MQSLLDRDIDRLVFEPPELGCVLYLPELPGSGSKIYDRSPYGNVGTIVGATWKRLPSGLWCLYFDGDDYVKIPIGLEALNTFTCLAWFNTSSGGTIFGSDGNVAGSNAYLLRVATTLRFVLEGGTSVNIASSATVNDGKWHLGASVKDGNTIARLSVDGVEDGRDETVYANLAWSNLCLGCLNASGTPAVTYTGSLAVVRLIGRAFNASEIRGIFNQEKHLFGVW